MVGDLWVVIWDFGSGINHLHLEAGYTGVYSVWSSIDIAQGIIRPSGKKIECQPLVEVEANVHVIDNHCAAYSHTFLVRTGVLFFFFFSFLFCWFLFFL